MITGLHAVIYARNAEADRALFRDVFGSFWIDEGAGADLRRTPS